MSLLQPRRNPAQVRVNPSVSPYGEVALTKSHVGRLARVATVLSFLLLTGCPELMGVPASQVWAITWADCALGTCGTNLTVLKGGAISQRGTPPRAFVGACSYSIPVTGQLSGTIFKIVQSGAGCNEAVQSLSQGDANGEYGKATSARGTTTWTFRGGAPAVTDTWTATFLY